MGVIIKQMQAYLPENIQATKEKLVAELVKAGLTEEAAETKVFGDIYQTPEGKEAIDEAVKQTQEAIDNGEIEKIETTQTKEPWQMAASSKEFADLSIDELDKAAFGFSREDITELMPKQLTVKWETDYDNAVYQQENSGLNKQEWAKQVDLSEPIEVSYENGKFNIEDGYHRYYAATILRKPLNVDLTIKDKPHRAIIEKALSEGKQVPAEVLKDYPDLMEKGTSMQRPTLYVKYTAEEDALLDRANEFLEITTESGRRLFGKSKEYYEENISEAQKKERAELESLGISFKTEPEEVRWVYIMMEWLCT